MYVCMDGRKLNFSITLFGYTKLKFKLKPKNHSAEQSQTHRLSPMYNLYFCNLIPESDKILISSYNVSPGSNIKATRIGEIITN